MAQSEKEGTDEAKKVNRDQIIAFLVMRKRPHYTLRAMKRLRRFQKRELRAVFINQVRDTSNLSMRIAVRIQCHIHLKGARSY